MTDEEANIKELFDLYNIEITEYDYAVKGDDFREILENARKNKLQQYYDQMQIDKSEFERISQQNQQNFRAEVESLIKKNEPGRYAKWKPENTFKRVNSPAPQERQPLAQTVTPMSEVDTKCLNIYEKYKTHASLKNSQINKHLYLNKCHEVANNLKEWENKLRTRRETFYDQVNPDCNDSLSDKKQTIFKKTLLHHGQPIDKYKCHQSLLSAIKTPPQHLIDSDKFGLFSDYVTDKLSQKTNEKINDKCRFEIGSLQMNEDVKRNLGYDNMLRFCRQYLEEDELDDDDVDEPLKGSTDYSNFKFLFEANRGEKK